MTDTYRFPIKCLGCGLHYNVYSWSDNWSHKYDPHCPECGRQKSLVMGVVKENKEIYNFVGGVVD